MIVNCMNCGKDFDKRPSLVKKSKRHFCSMDCQHKWRTGKTGTIEKPKGLNINCETCKKEFYIYPSEIGKKKFCSRKCKGIKHGEERRKRVIVPCDNCGSIIERQPAKIMPHNFCDNLCMGAFYSKEGTKLYNCDCCGKTFERNPSSVRTTLKFCSVDCRDNYEFHPMDDTWGKIRKRILERDNYTCQICFNSYPIMHVHHIVPKMFYEDIQKANDEGNLSTRCEFCHKKEESHYWKEVPIQFKHLL